MSMRTGRLLAGGGALVALVLDQLLKLWVLEHLEYYVTVDVIPALSSLFSFTLLTNTGVAFGLFPQLGDLFALLAAGVVIVILLFYRSLGQANWMLHLGLGLQIGGALGNLADRLFRGSVVDFIDVNFWPLHNWPVFNIADAAIVVGVGLLLVGTWLQERAEEKEPQEVAVDA